MLRNLHNEPNIHRKPRENQSKSAPRSARNKHLVGFIKQKMSNQCQKKKIGESE